MPDHRLARTRSGYEGYVYQPVRPNPPVIFDCAQVAKTWRDHYEPETSQPRETYVSDEALAVLVKEQKAFNDTYAAWRASRVR